MTKVEKLRLETFKDLLNKLDKYGKCALIRCTGFGKTVMATKLFSRYTKVLYLYPSDCVKNVVTGRYADDCSNVEFMTYNWVATRSTGELEEIKGYDLIIADECHRIGAVQTRKNLHTILNKNTKAHFVGVTATPDRMDLIDIIDEFFDNIVVFEYTLHNAFKDGVVKCPYYVYCTYDIETTLRKEALKCGLGESEVKTVIDSRLIEIFNLIGMPQVIKKTCNMHVKDTSYMKFIVFFKTSAKMDSKGKDVIEWFQEAYPNHNINALIVRSDKKEYKENVNKLDELSYRKNTIDLIYAIDMLNIGYHIDDLTGIMMYRGTESGTVFIQQLGRALSSGSTDAAIVFDVVDNLHRKSLYSDLKTRNMKKSRVKLIDKTAMDKGSSGENSEHTDSNGDGIEITPSNGWWHHANDILAEDLRVSDFMATYKEVIAKAVAEPISMRARSAFEEWFEYNKSHGRGEPELTRQTFLDETWDKYVPLAEFAWKKNVSITAICDLILKDKAV